MRWLLLLSFSVSLHACGQKTAQESTSGVSGIVINGFEQPIEGAVVTLGGHTALSGANGAFVLHVPAKPRSYVAVRIKAAGYPEAVRRLQLPAAGTARVEVRLAPVDLSRTFQIPVGTQRIAFSVNHGLPGATVTIPGDSLVNSRGGAVSGTAEIDLTFWSPDDNLNTVPAPLRASTPGDPRDERPLWLLSYGMVDIDIRQNGEKLQVAPDKVLELTMQTSAQRRDALAQRPKSIPRGPTLWTLDQNTGLWGEDTGDSTYDVTSGELVSVLHHLSTKNADEPYTETGPPVGNSSCIQGRAMGACGQFLPNAQIYLNIVPLGYGGTNYTYVTGPNGYFKENFVPSGHADYFFTATWNGRTTDMKESPRDAALIYVPNSLGTPAYPRVHMALITCADKSGACTNSTCACFNDPSDPGGCMEALEAADPAVNGYNPCWANPLSSSWLGDCYNDNITVGAPDTHYNTVWKSYTPTTLCGNCWPLLDAVFKDVAGDQTPGCTGAGAYGTGCCPTVPPPNAYNVCNDLSSPHRKLLGQPCVTGEDTCCSTGGQSALLCSDFVCVPVTDPTSQP